MVLRFRMVLHLEGSSNVRQRDTVTQTYGNNLAALMAGHNQAGLWYKITTATHHVDLRPG